MVLNRRNSTSRKASRIQDPEARRIYRDARDAYVSDYYLQTREKEKEFARETLHRIARLDREFGV